MYGILVEDQNGWSDSSHIVSHSYTVKGADELLKSERRLFKILCVRPVFLSTSIHHRINKKAEWLKLHNATCA